MTALRIAVIAGDGIGKEVVPEGIRVVDAAARAFGIDIRWDHFDWGCDYHALHGRMMPEDGLKRIASHDAIYLGAVGWPTVPDAELLWTLLMPIRRGFEQYVNLRPVRHFAGVPSPLADPGAIDFLIVRENNEGEYCEMGGRMFPGSDDEFVLQDTVMTRRGCDRVMKYAFDLARGRPRRKVTSATKSNGIIHTMPFWDERFRAMAASYGDVAAEQYHIDILTAHFVRRPSSFDVVVASNLFGDILSDLGAAVTGTIGIAPSACLNPERRFPSMFEPVHGAAPDIAGQNIANPIGQIWSGAMMLDHLGAKDAAAAIVTAIERVLASGENLTRDMGGDASTQSLGQVIAADVSAKADRAGNHV